MIELIVIWCFGRTMYETAQQKGRRGWLWVFLLIATWFGAQFIGAVVVSIGWALIFGVAPGGLILYVLALACAFTAGLLLGKFLDGRTSLKPPPLAIRPQPRAVSRPPATAPATTMAYHISQGGQQGGPYDLAQLRELWHSGAISPDSLYWFEGAQDWQPVTKLSKLLAS